MLNEAVKEVDVKYGKTMDSTWKTLYGAWVRYIKDLKERDINLSGFEFGGAYSDTKIKAVFKSFNNPYTNKNIVLATRKDYDASLWEYNGSKSGWKVVGQQPNPNNNGNPPIYDSTIVNDPTKEGKNWCFLKDWH